MKMNTAKYEKAMNTAKNKKALKTFGVQSVTEPKENFILL